MRALLFSVCFIFVPAVWSPVGAQDSRSSRHTQTSVSQRAKYTEPGVSSSSLKNQQRALAVLRQILVDSSQFEETFLKPLNILYLKYRIADLLWEQDPKLARRLFVEAFQEAGDKRLDTVSNMSLRLRQEILELLLPHDASLAEELANSITRQNDVPHMQALRQQATLMAQIATGIEHSPQQEATLIQQSFNGFFGPQQLDTLEREAELYQQFFSQPATDLIAKAEQTEDQSKRTELYGQAAYILTIQRKFEEAIELLKRIPANNGEAVIGDAHLYSLAAEDSIEKGEIEQAAKYLRKIKDPASLTGGLIKIARIYITQDKAPQAKRLLEEAKRNLKLVTDQTTGVRLMVAIANTEAKLDSSRGFRDMEAAVETLNRIGWGEGNGHAMGPDGITLRMNTYDFSEGLVLLARADFSRSLSLAKKCDKKRPRHSL